jgi:hypothetical protein
MSELLDFLARRAEEEPFFLASLLALFSRSEGLGDEGLAHHLGCPVTTLTDLRLCRSPRPDGVGFQEDVASIAGRFGLDVERLIGVVRRGQMVQKLRAVPGRAAPGLLAAARDREPPPEPEDPPDPEVTP